MKPAATFFLNWVFLKHLCEEKYFAWPCDDRKSSRKIFIRRCCYRDSNNERVFLKLSFYRPKKEIHSDNFLQTYHPQVRSIHGYDSSRRLYAGASGKETRRAIKTSRRLLWNVYKTLLAGKGKRNRNRKNFKKSQIVFEILRQVNLPSEYFLDASYARLQATERKYS